MNFKQFNRESYIRDIKNSCFADRKNYIEYYDTYYSPLVKRYVEGTPGTLSHLNTCRDLVAQYKQDYEALGSHIVELENIINQLRCYN